MYSLLAFAATAALFTPTGADFTVLSASCDFPQLPAPPSNDQSYVALKSDNVNAKAAYDAPGSYSTTGGNGGVDIQLQVVGCDTLLSVVQQGEGSADWTVTQNGNDVGTCTWSDFKRVGCKGNECCYGKYIDCKSSVC